MKKDEINLIINEIISLREEIYLLDKRYRIAIKEIYGKWIYFNDKDSPSHHGRILKSFLLPLKVRCKNGCIRYVNPEEIVAIFDTKKECFDYKPEENDVV